MSHLLSPEFRLALACCRAVTFDEPVVVVEGLDWSLFRAVVERHRIAGIAWRALAPSDRMPENAREPLAASARIVAASSLRAASQAARLNRALSDHGIDHLFLKGSTLAALAYDDSAIKSAWDVDLLVDPRAVGAAGAVLDRLGYRLILPSDRRRLISWHRRRRESVWAFAGDGPHVELHTRLTDNPLLIPSLGLASPRQHVATPGPATLETFAPDELFAYLCAHGASSAWFRLKWLADLAALLAKSDPAEISRLFRCSQRLGAGRSTGQALLLVNDLLGIAIEPALLAELQASRALRRLADLALKALLGPEPTGHRLGTLPIHLSQFGLSPSLSFKLRELRTQAGVALANRMAGLR